jgi:hypothetical protein
MAVLLGWIRAKLTLTVDCELMLLNIMKYYFLLPFREPLFTRIFFRTSRPPFKGRRTLSLGFYCGGGNW